MAELCLHIHNAKKVNRISVVSYGARAPSTSNCLIFLVTLEPHKLGHWTWLPTQKEYTVDLMAYSFVAVYCMNLFLCHP